MISRCSVKRTAEMNLARVYSYNAISSFSHPFLADQKRKPEFRQPRLQGTSENLVILPVIQIHIPFSEPVFQSAFYTTCTSRRPYVSTLEMTKPNSNLLGKEALYPFSRYLNIELMVKEGKSRKTNKKGDHDIPYISPIGNW